MIRIRISVCDTLNRGRHLLFFRYIALDSMAKKSKSKNKSANNKQIEAQRRRDRKQNKKREHEICDPDMKIQLEKIGLGLKEIPGDG